MDYQKLFGGAQSAGCLAAQACIPQPMHIRGYAPINDGVCGFAYVTVNPARGPFVSFLKKMGIGHKAYRGGWEFSISQYGQSMERKESHARAVAEFLTANGVAGVSYYSRMD